MTPARAKRSRRKRKRGCENGAAAGSEEGKKDTEGESRLVPQPAAATTDEGLKRVKEATAATAGGKDQSKWG